MKWVRRPYLRTWISIFDLFISKHSLQKRKKCSLIVELINKGEIEFFLLRKQDWLVCKYYKIIHIESLITQYRIVVLDVCISSRKKIENKSNMP